MLSKLYLFITENSFTCQEPWLRSWRLSTIYFFAWGFMWCSQFQSYVRQKHNILSFVLITDVKTHFSILLYDKWQRRLLFLFCFMCFQPLILLSFWFPVDFVSKALDFLLLFLFTSFLLVGSVMQLKLYSLKFIQLLGFCTKIFLL